MAKRKTPVAAATGIREVKSTMFNSIVQSNALFKGLTNSEISATLHLLQAQTHTYAKGEILQNIGMAFSHAGIVIKGQIEESCIIEDFSKIKLGDFFAGDLFGVAFAIEQINSPVQLIAQSECTVIELSFKPLLDKQDQLPSFYCHLMGNLSRFLAKQDIHDTIRMHIASQRTIHDKLIVYLQHLPIKSNGYRTIPFSQTKLANFLGVNRSALSRTISKMKNDAEVVMHGNEVKIMH